jgi:hypothetical protein
MSLINVLRKGVAIASKVTDSLKVTVMHEAWTGSDGNGTDTFASPVARRALCDLTKRVRYTQSGMLIMTFATLTFLDHITDTTPTSGQVRQNPIDARDIMTLPDGGTAPIMQAGGFDDPGSNRPLLQEVVLGTVVRGQ